MSKYWKLNRDPLSSNKGLLSKDSLSDDYSVRTSSKEDINLTEISNFYNYNYRLDKSVDTIQLSPIDLSRYLNIDCEILTILKEDKLIGSIISMVVPIKSNTKIMVNKANLSDTNISDRFKNKIGSDSTIMATTSFLILDRKYRGKGYGMALIQESLKILFDNGSSSAYFINSVSRCSNSIPLYTWYFPSNLVKLDEVKYIYPKNYKSLFTKDNNKNKIVKVDNTNAEKVLSAYLSLIKDKNIFFYPSLSHWKKWIESFPTYAVLDQSFQDQTFENNSSQDELTQNIIGVFSFNSNNVKYPLCNDSFLLNGYLLFSIGKQPETINGIIHMSKQLHDILILYEIGDLSSRLLSSVNAQKDGKRFINFFNTHTKFSSSQFYAPLI